MNLDGVMSNSAASIWYTVKEATSKRIGNKVIIEKGIKDEIILGPVTSEGGSFTASVTNHAVEKGINITDHVKSNPDTFTIKTFLSDKNDLAAVAIDALKVAIGASVDKLSVTDKINKLKDWKDNGKFVTYSGPKFSGLLTKGYDVTEKNLIITSVSIARSRDTGSGLEVSISFQKVIVAEAVTQKLKLDQAVKPVTDKGQQNASILEQNFTLPSLFGGKK